MVNQLNQLVSGGIPSVPSPQQEYSGSISNVLIDKGNLEEKLGSECVMESSVPSEMIVMEEQAGFRRQKVGQSQGGGGNRDL